MEPKRELSSVDIAALTRELRDYEGAHLEKAYLYDEDLLRLKMRKYDHGRIELLIDVGETKHARIGDPDTVPPAPERPPNFAMMMRNRLAGASLSHVEQFEFDRILILEFTREADSTRIVAELFGDGNVAVLDEVDAVVDCLEPIRLQSRTVVPGSQYEFPAARFNPLKADFEAVRARLEQSDTDVVRTLATQLNFGGKWAEELCTRAGVEKTLDVENAGEREFEAIFREIQELARLIAGGDFDPRIYRSTPDDDSQSPGPAIDVTPLSLEEYRDLAVDHYERFTDALDDYFTNLDREEAVEPKSQRPDFGSQIEKQERIIEQQENAIESFDEEAGMVRESAKALYAHYDLVDEVLSTVREARESGTSWEEIADRFEEGAEAGIEAAQAVESVDGSEGTVTMAVDDHTVSLAVADGVEKNADRLYQEAKRIEGKKDGAQEAIESTRQQLAAIERERDEWEQAQSGPGETADARPTRGANGEGEGEEKGNLEKSPADWLAQSSIPIRQSEQWYERFRWFHTSDAFLVIGGRNADQNEEIVKKYLEPGDKFFHAQAHGGPATVLKATDPSESYSDGVDIPERSLEEAAQFAVSYSSVWKDGAYGGDVYMVDHDQVSKTPESGEFLEKGGFAIRGDRRYFEDVAVGVAVGITCEPETRVIGGPPGAIEPRAAATIEVEPGRYAQNDAAKQLYREFKGRFADDTFVRKIASPDLIQEFLPPGTSDIVSEE